MSKLTLTKQAQETLDWVEAGNHPSDDEDAPEGIREFISGISCSDGFWYGLTTGGYIDAKKIVVEACERELVQSELEELENIWSKISYEF